MSSFPYRVKPEYQILNDGRCCAEVKNDATFADYYRCTKKATKFIDDVGLCGIHARMVNKWLEDNKQFLDSIYK